MRMLLYFQEVENAVSHARHRFQKVGEGMRPDRLHEPAHTACLSSRQAAKMHRQPLSRGEDQPAEEASRAGPDAPQAACGSNTCLPREVSRHVDAQLGSGRSRCGKPGAN